MGFCFGFVLVILTIIFPPLGVLMIAGCSGDIVVNLILTLLGWIPGYIHAIYLIVVFYHRRGLRRRGVFLTNDAPLIFSHKVQSGGLAYRGRRTY
ncbi:hypothetical protein LZ554_002981 [Drepanopeziza brunnea f. sp. 'monogermtubi']|uniref:Plasma membrane proteolipid 3 n=1 Tax=Marssonina brunnea f. sp. multigermtubi (strain MB_m1) TaxID=1072389 RepID=K1Y6Z8_MARBU|nr:Plasma membrane proteolipid 3 [Drepanopeziza brunnea f. sp. 'multigermtubi' MB_m1]EKD20969.1 Plasma membrane proteolipid 3 [Drepanopeziza brunnea f. sp. 'multigermtubi' MB_m1]KAI9052704.1 hypothetical protein LZ554_002981 [Drepanopeziza brunnea f. sp. 'monogermtubi']KAJ5042028.1 hypothetical protein L3040_004588 [Drepanopeziza brunnea f. sp. 'multigermtubi']